ncbi:MAG: glutamylcysteine synthetase, partial [Oscillospiraceae bacterium]|nr:glutamylcysteine synthetase [Oscillospiraceae bacterium]
MTTTRTLLDEAIYQKYIVPTEREAGRWVGPEFEFPVISLHKCPVSIPGLQEVVKAFAVQFGFSRIKRDDNGDIYSLADPVTGDDLSFDCSFNTLELSFGKERSIVVLDGRFRQYYAFLQKALRQRGMMLT